MENVRAAMPIASSNTLTEKEFQVLLGSWLEEKGILSDLRLQLRFKMVNALRDTAIGNDICKNSVNQLSLYKQAINTIVAEFLMHNKCYYSLSVFNTESLSHLLVDSTNILDIRKTLNGQNLLHKEKILNIMELIGISKSSHHAEDIITFYFNEQENNSLLCCIIKLLSKLIAERDRLQNFRLDINPLALNAKANFMDQVQDLLILSGLGGDTLKTIVETMTVLYKIDKKQIEDYHLNLKAKLKMEIDSKNRQKREMFKYNKILKNQLMKVKTDYKKSKLHLKKLHDNCTEDNYVEKYNEIETPVLKESSLISNCLKIPKGPHIEVCQLQHCNVVCKEHIKANENLTNQNKGLLEENRRQKEEINELLLKYKHLINGFTDCQQKITLINSKIKGEMSEGCCQNIPYEDIIVSSGPFRKNIDLSDTNSDTEGIVQETRLRLEQLEKETRMIEEKCRSLHLNT